MSLINDNEYVASLEHIDTRNPMRVSVFPILGNTKNNNANGGTSIKFNGKEF